MARPGQIEGKTKATLYLSDEVHRALRIRAAETGESMGDITGRALRKELGMMTDVRGRTEAELRERADLIDLDATTYTDLDGTEHHAVQITWQQVREILGHEHTGTAEDDRRLIQALRDAGAPAWVAEADGWTDDRGWGLIGPTAFTPWQDLRLYDRDDAEITDARSRRAALEEFRRTGAMNGVFFGRLGLPHEDPEDASTWGPESPDFVDWTGFGDGDDAEGWQTWCPYCGGEIYIPRDEVSPSAADPIEWAPSALAEYCPRCREE